MAPAPAPVPDTDQSWSSTTTFRPSKSLVAHPLCPLTANEITITADLVRSKYPPNTDLHFKALTLEEPPKSVLVPYLDAEHGNGSLPHIDRKSFAAYYIRNTVCNQNGAYRHPTVTTGAKNL